MKAPWNQYERLQVHVSASNRTLIRKAQKMLSAEGKSRAHRIIRHQWLRSLIAHHQDARKTFGFVMK